MKRKILITILLMALILSVFTGCNKENPPEPEQKPTDNFITDVASITDGDYSIEIIGLSENPIVMTKSEIFLLATGDNKVIYGKDNPVSPSDKQDPITLEKIKHYATGVKLSAVVSSLGKSLSQYSSIEIDSLDGFKNTLTSNVYDTQKGGSECILAYIYDGDVVTASSISGALRLVCPNQVNNTWVKKIKKITFNEKEKTKPNPNNVVFMENLMEYDGQYDYKDNDDNYYIRKGISLQKLIDNNIISMTSEDNIYARAYDLIINSELTTSYYKKREYFYVYEDIHNALIVYKKQLRDVPNAGWEDEYNAPSLESGGLLSAMKTKNLLYLSTSTDVIVSLDQCFIALETNTSENGMYIDFYSLIEELGMDKDGDYNVFDKNDSMASIVKSDITSVRVVSKDNKYYIEIIDKAEFKTTVELKRISKIND